MHLKILSQKLITSEKIIQDNKENLLSLAKEHNNEIQEKLEEFNKERKELNEKIDKLNIEINTKETELQIFKTPKSFLFLHRRNGKH